MSNLEKDSKLQGIRPVLEEFDKIDPEISERISAEVQEIQNKDFLTCEGALTDVVTPSATACPEVRREAQIFSATQDENAPISMSRRRFFALIAIYFGGVAQAYLGGLATDATKDALSSDETYDEGFIREILRLDSNKLDLLDLRDHLLSSGQSKVARLVTLLSPSGESFEDTYEYISELEHIIKGARLSKFSEVYLNRALSHHYSYLGLHLSAKNKFSKYSTYETNDKRLNVQIINAQHMNRYKELYSQGNFAEALSEDNLQLADSYLKHFDTDITSLEIGALRQARSVTSECAALKGLYLANLCMAATSEKEALSALTEIDEFRKYMFLTLDTSKQEYLVIRSYGEVLWWYGRVVTIAFLKSWDKVVERCLVSFYDSAATVNQAEAGIFNTFHLSHKSTLRSPVWLQMALIRAMWSEVRFGSGQSTLANLIAEEHRYQFKHNSEISRSYNALTIAFGQSPSKIPVSQTLATIETPILVDCIRTMIDRRSSLSMFLNPV